MTSPRAVTDRAKDGVARITLDRPAMLNRSTEEANRAWQERREAVYDPRPGPGQPHGQ